MAHFYRNVPKLGNVEVSRHAKTRMLEENISSRLFEKVLLTPIEPDIPDGHDVIWRERDGVRLVILTNPITNRKAKKKSKLIKTIYRIRPDSVARR